LVIVGYQYRIFNVGVDPAAQELAYLGSDDRPVVVFRKSVVELALDTAVVTNTIPLHVQVVTYL
jgi:hypothetical protein